MSNPYQSPQFGGTFPQQFAPSGAPGIDREKLRRVARYQQWVIYSILANIGLYIASAAVRGQDLLVALAVTAVALFVLMLIIVSVSLLANELMGIGLAIVCGILMFVPCISLITLLVVNGKATTFLQQHGVKVGFMGANPNSI